MKSHLISIALCGLGLTSLAGCVAYKEPPPARSIEYGTYSCDGSKQFVAQFEPNNAQVALVMDGRTHMLSRDASGLYRDNIYSLSGSETVPITVTEDNVVIMRNCVPLTTERQYYRKDTHFRAFDLNRDVD